MSYKLWTYVTLSIIAFVGVVLFMQTTQFRSTDPVGPAFFPQIVIAIMILFCILSAISTARQKASENNEFKILNMPDIVFTIIVSIIYTYLWKIFGFSYIISFIFVAVLVFRYNKKDPLKRKIMNAAIASAIVNVSVFIVFDLLFNLTF